MGGTIRMMAETHRGNASSPSTGMSVWNGQRWNQTAVQGLLTKFIQPIISRFFFINFIARCKIVTMA